MCPEIWRDCCCLVPWRRRRCDAQFARKWAPGKRRAAPRTPDRALLPVRLPARRRPAILPVRRVKPVAFSAFLHVAQHFISERSVDHDEKRGFGVRADEPRGRHADQSSHPEAKSSSATRTAKDAPTAQPMMPNSLPACSTCARLKRYDFVGRRGLLREHFGIDELGVLGPEIRLGDPTGH